MSDCEKKLITQVDLARQANIITGNTACFDGKIQAGIPFSGYSSGVDLNTVTLLNPEDGDVQTAVLSGNNITTLFDVSNPSSPSFIPAMFTGTSQEGIPYSSLTWTNPLYSASTSGLTLPVTRVYTGETTIGPYWDITISGMNGTHPIALEYSGYSIQYDFYDLVSDISGNTFPPPPLSATTYTSTTGLITATYLAYSASSLDYTGPLDYLRSKEDATIDNKLTTKQIRVTEGASLGSIGYVLTQAEGDGTAIWAPSSGTTGLTNVFVTGGTLTGDELTLTRNDDVEIDIDLSGLSGGTIPNYINSASTTSTIGGITAGSSFPAPGKTMQEMWDLLLYPYQPPAFNAFTRTGINSNYEVGEETTPGVPIGSDFSWSTTQPANVDDLIPNSIKITDSAGNTLLNSQAKTGAGVAATITVSDVRTSVGSKVLYTIGGLNTIGGAFSRTISATWNSYVYYGMGGLTLSGVQMVALSNSQFVTSLTFGSVLTVANTGSNYLWVCVPDILTNVGSWTSAAAPITDFAGVTPIPGSFQADISIINSQGQAVNYKVWRQTFSQTSNPYKFQLNNV